MAKLLRAEIFALAKRIITEVDSNNQEYNSKLVESQEYKDAIKAIGSSSIITGARKSLERTLRSKFGNEWNSIVNLSLTAKSGTKALTIENQISAKIVEYNKSVFKPRFDIAFSSYDLKYHDIYNKVVDAITIAQMELTDVELIVAQVKSILS